MPFTEEMITVGEAARELGITPQALRNAIMRGLITVVPLDRRTNLIDRAQVEKYRTEHLGRRGKRPRTADALTEQQRKQRAYQHAYYQRRKAARHQKQQPATEPAEDKE